MFLQSLHIEIMTKTTSDIIVDILQKVNKLLWKWNNYLIDKMKVILPPIFPNFWQTRLHPICLKNPPSLKYRRRFLTELIKRVGLVSLQTSMFYILSPHILRYSIFSWRLIVVAWDVGCWTSGCTVWSARRGHVCTGGGHVLQNLLIGESDHISTGP